MRKGQSHAVKTREKIKSSMLINALVNHVAGKKKMSTTQVRAAEILLRKTLPDLQAIQHEVDEETFTMIMNFKGKE